MAGSGKKGDEGHGEMPYSMVCADSYGTDGMEYTMGSKDGENDGGGMGYSMSARPSEKGSGMKYVESNTKGRVEEDGYTQNGKK